MSAVVSAALRSAAATYAAPVVPKHAAARRKVPAHLTDAQSD